MEREKLGYRYKHRRRGGDGNATEMDIGFYRARSTEVDTGFGPGSA